MVVGRTAGVRLCGFSRVTFRPPTVLALFLLYNAHVPGHSSIPNTLPFAFYLHLSFKIVLKRKEGAAKNCEESIPGFD